MPQIWSLSQMRFRNFDDAIDCTRFLGASYTLVDAVFYNWLKRAKLTRTHISVLHLRYDESPQTSREQWSLRETLRKKYPRYKRFQSFLDDIMNEEDELIDTIDTSPADSQNEPALRQSVTAFVDKSVKLIEEVMLSVSHQR